MGEHGASVVIIGAGIVGASIAYHLAARGCTDVVVLEREAAEVTGSSARSLAGVRHQFSDPLNIRLSLYSAARIRHFAEELGADSGFRQVGYLLLVDDPATWAHFQRDVALQHSLGARVEVLAPAEAARFVPGTHTADLVGATFGPDDGYCDPHAIATGYLARARERGVRLLRARPATGLTLAGGRVVAVETPAGPLGCEVVVNAAGCWAGEVGALAGLAIPVRPYRRCVYMTAPLAAIPGEVPLSIDVGSGFYLRKAGPGVVFGLSNPDEPPGVNLEVDWAWLETVWRAGCRRFPVLEDAALVEARCWAGLYEITPDDMPVLGRHPDLPNYVDASGFSGHGVMHSPATGLLIAEEILDGRAHTIGIDGLRITRFRDHRPRAERNVY
ncbi:MAG TPA: FAD-binding oxidoreductase [Thermomicrobiales bacterium]|nr:FAD-binding oxidoreductase [Thermomicrobiales bacterium]